MRFIDLLNEKFWKGLKIGNDYVEVYQDSPAGEIADIMRSGKISQNIRAGVTKDLKSYFWLAELTTHHAIKNKANLKFIFTYEYDRGNQLVFSDDGNQFKAYPLNIRKGIKQSIKKSFPRAKKLEMYQFDSTGSKKVTVKL